MATEGAHPWLSEGNIMTSRARNLLLKIGQTQEAALRLTKGNAQASQELKDLSLADFIPCSQGGAVVALTQKGLDIYEDLWTQQLRRRT